MELAGLEPTTSWVRCITGGEIAGTDGRESPAFMGDLASAPTGVGARLAGYGCTCLVPAPQARLPAPIH